VREVRKDEWNPGEEKIPDESKVASGIAVGDTRYHQENADRTSGIQQEEDGQIMPVLNEKVPESIHHIMIVSLAIKTR
jgi:hypothetical protein